MLKSKIQSALAQKGFYKGAIDGVFGAKSVEAAALSLGVPNNLRSIQVALANKGFYKGSVDGIFGDKSFKALADFLGVVEDTAPSKLAWKSAWDKNLEGVHPDLQKIVRRAAEKCPIPFIVVEGVRSDKQAYINWGKGRSVEQCRAAGVPTAYAQPQLAKVTWLRNPLATKHRRQADGYGHAVDLLPAPYDWKDLKNFDIVAKAMFDAQKELLAEKAITKSIRWGADWDGDGKPRERGETDSPHFEV